MPTVLRQGPWRFFFYSNEGSEPPHIHVVSTAGAGGTAKFLLTPVRMVRSRALSAHELRRIESFVVEHQEELVRAWNEHFSVD
jgi:Domain of unknown function (DUF4160)